MKKLTAEEFIKKAKEVHGDRYNYSKVNYINSQEKVCIICPEHGEFWQKPYNHLNGAKCPLCNRRKWNTETFIEEARKVHGDRYDYSKVVFKSCRDKVCIILHEKDRNGNEIGEFWQLPLLHINGGGSQKEQRGRKEECWEVRKCPICGNEFKVRKKYKKICCSEECRLRYVELHKDEINEKKRVSLQNTLLKKTQEEKDKIRERIKNTCIEKYGVDNFSKTDEARKISSEKMKIFKKKWDEHVLKDILIPKYTKICENDNLELLEFRGRFDCDVRCKKCGNVFNTKCLGYLSDSTTKNICRVCHPIEPLLGPTIFEKSFEDFLIDIGVRYYKNDRNIIAPQEIDFFLPDYGVGFELDGLYWHSEIQKPVNYHVDKTEKCNKLGIRLIHIFEDEWINKQEICKSRIKSILGMSDTKIYARKCVVSEIDNITYRNFINANHIQGVHYGKFYYGLFFNGELVSVMSFSGLRKNLGRKTEDGSYELLRFCNKLNTNVIGGAGKLLKYFIKINNPKSIISYADRRWSNGNMYYKLGFSFVRNSKPSYSYVINGERKDRFGFRKSELVKRYNCPKEMSEHEFCLSNNWYRIYDCGTMVFEKLCV